MAAVATAAVIVNAAASTASAYANYDATQRSAHAQKSLEKQQAADIAKETADRDAQKARAASVGSRFGYMDAFATGLGYQTGAGPRRPLLTGGGGS